MKEQYVQGFIQKCAEAGVDPEELAKTAQALGLAPDGSAPQSAGNPFSIFHMLTGGGFRNRPQVPGADTLGAPVKPGQRTPFSSLPDLFRKRKYKEVDPESLEFREFLKENPNWGKGLRFDRS